MAEIDALRTVIALPIVYGDAQISVSTCIGVATSPDDGDDPETLLRAADSRLYVEKRLLKSGAYARAA